MQLVFNENRPGKETAASPLSWVPKQFGEFIPFVMGNEEEVLPSPLLVKHLMEMTRGKVRGLSELSKGR